MEPTNEELAQSFDDAAQRAEETVAQIEEILARGYVLIGLDEPVEDVLASERELARLMRLNAQGARELRS